MVISLKFVFASTGLSLSVYCICPMSLQAAQMAMPKCPRVKRNFKYIRKFFSDISVSKWFELSYTEFTEIITSHLMFFVEELGPKIRPLLGFFILWRTICLRQQTLPINTKDKSFTIKFLFTYQDVKGTSFFKRFSISKYRLFSSFFSWQYFATHSGSAMCSSEYDLITCTPNDTVVENSVSSQSSFS